MNRKDRPLINAEARRVLGSTFCICNVGLCWPNHDFTGEEVLSDGTRLTWDYNNSRDLYDNGTMLRDMKLPSKDWSGTLDIWVYSYQTIAELREGYQELEFNLYAKFVQGRLVEVTDK